MKLDNLKDKNLIHGDLGVWAVFILLCTISLIEVYSASSRMTFATGAKLVFTEQARLGRS